MKYHLLIIFLLIHLEIIAQSECLCKNELSFVVSYIEQNLPGFRDNVWDENLADYTEFKSDLRAEASQLDTKVDCFKLLTRFVEFFKDNHSRIQMDFPSIDESDSAAVQKFLTSELYLERETFQLRGEDLVQHPLEDVRGMYQTKDSTYTIVVLPAKDLFRDYVGVVIESRSPLWKRGQIKLELSVRDGSFEAFSYLRNHAVRHTSDFGLESGVLGDTWYKTSLPNRQNFVSNHSRTLHFKTLNKNITYLRIPTFSGSWSARLDSLYLAAASTIEKNPYLLIDVRNNGGGSDNNVLPLWKYIYTGPVVGDEVRLYVTADNIRKWEEWSEQISKDTINYTEAQVFWFQEEVRRMKEAELGSFIVRSTRDTTKRKIFERRPKKVLILYNKYCASSCESLLFLGKQSDNTVLVGENSAGYVGYGEVGATQTPCFGYTLHTTMTRYEDQRALEVDGVAPDIQLTYDKDWLEQAMAVLNDGQE